MTTNINDEAAFRQALLTSPGERQAVEYKSANAFDDNKEFGLKLIKHILGMANIGGGWIVIGFNDGTLTPDLNHSTEISATYDTTRLSDTANRYVERGQSVEMSVFMEVHPQTQLSYPIIRVEEFERIPFICRSTKSASDTGEQVLQIGKVYIRRPGAATSELRTVADWEDLLRRCVSKRRDEFLQEITDLFRRLNSGDSVPSEDSKARLDRWKEEQWDASGIHGLLGNDGVYMESAQMLVLPPDSTWTHQNLRRAALSDMWRYQDDLVIPSQEGIEVSMKHPYRPQYWYLDKRGNCYYSSALVENYQNPSFGHPPRSLWVDVSIHRIALALLQSADLYKELSIPPDQPYLVSIKHGGLKGRTSYASSQKFIGYIAYPYSPRISQEDSHIWQGEVTQDLVRGRLTELTHEIASGLFALFNFTEVPIGVIGKLLAESHNDRGVPLLQAGA